MVQLRIFVNLRKEIRRLSYEEKGMLLDAMLAYAEDKTLLPLSGKADVLWDVIQERIDAQHASYEEKCANLSKARDQNPCNNKLIPGNKDLTSGEVNLSLSNFEVQEQVQVQVQEQVQDKKRYSKEKKPPRKRVSNFQERKVSEDDFKDLYLDLNQEIAYERSGQ